MNKRQADAEVNSEATGDGQQHRNDDGEQQQVNLGEVLDREPAEMSDKMATNSQVLAAVPLQIRSSEGVQIIILD